MAAVEITISGMLYDKINRTQQNVVLIGEAFLTGYAPGHPLPPEGPGRPPSGSLPHPEHPIMLPGMPGWGDNLRPEHPIVLPPEPLPPDVTVPPPGSPPVIVGGRQPVNPITPPPFIVVNYPGIGKVIVPQPVPPPAPEQPAKK